MELQNSKKILHDALVGGYGVGAFNFVNMEMVKCILDTAEAKKSPVIIQCSTGAIKYAGADTLVAMARAYTKNMTVPVCLNLDHGKTYEDCKNAIDAGFTNVMIDASSLPYEENIALTKKCNVKKAPTMLEIKDGSIVKMLMNASDIKGYISAE